MARPATNTLIVTKLSEDIKDPAVLAHLLGSKELNVELVHLPKFDRYIIICASATLASFVRDYLQSALPKSVHIGFSIRDNDLSFLGDQNWALEQGQSDYLELPSEEGSRRFLILPPLSPQTEWNDYNKVEDGPHPKAVYSPEELSHLLWDRFGGFDSSRVKRFQDESEDEDDEDTIDISSQPQILFENIDNGVPAIVVDSVRNQQGKPKPMPKTTMPPVQ